MTGDDPFGGTPPFSYTVRHSPLDTIARHPIGEVVSPEVNDWDYLANTWHRLHRAAGRLPDYRDFDILTVPPRLWAHTCVTSLEGRPRRFFVRMIGGAIELNNGFYGNRRFMTDIPIKNRHVMEREFAWTLRLQRPIYSEGPYIGAADYVKQVRRMITPYRLSDREYCFVFHAEFSPMPGRESQMLVP